MSKYQCSRLNMLYVCMMLVALVFHHNAFCAYAGPEDIQLYPTKKRCCATLGLITFALVMSLKSHDAQESSPSLWQEDGCPLGCKAAFNASGFLVNTSSSEFGHWAPWVVGCNGAPYSQDHCAQWESGRILNLCLKPYPWLDAKYRAQNISRIGWKSNSVTKEKMIAIIRSYCTTYEHISFCHCPYDPQEGYCVFDPLDIVSRMAEYTECYPPPALGNSTNITEKISKKLFKSKDTLKERLKTQGHTKFRDFKSKHTFGNHTIQQPRQRTKR